MDAKKYIVYNKARESFLSSSVTSVNAALEPLKVLKVLIEGLPANARTGLWLTNFKGVPVARTLSPFDLVYLDKDLRIVHSVELSKDGEFASFKGQPASALVLPPRSISASKTRDGDDLELRLVESAAPEAADVPVEEQVTSEPADVVETPKETPAPVEAPSTARFYSPAANTPAPSVDQAPLERFVSAQSSPSVGSAAPAEELMSSAAELPAAPEPVPAPDERTAAPLENPFNPPVPNPAPQGKKRRLVTGPILTAPPQYTRKPAAPAEPPPSARAPIPFPSAPAARSTAPTIQEVPPQDIEIPITLYPQQRGSAKPQEELPSPAASAAPAPIAVPKPPAPSPVPAPKIASPLAVPVPIPAEPVALPPAEIPRPVDIPDYAPEPKRRFSWKIRVLRWLFPELVIREAAKPRDRRRADRQSLPNLIAYFFTGGAPEPQKIRNISVTGFYLQTEDRWMPGTVVRMTLQKMGSKGDDPSDTITVNSRIVRWGPDGEGFEFILTDLDD
jgi:hypothetical protein